MIRVLCLESYVLGLRYGSLNLFTLLPGGAAPAVTIVRAKTSEEIKSEEILVF